MRKGFNRLYGNMSPWVVIGTSAILLVVVIVLAAMNYNRENEYMSRMLSEKGAALIRSFEAGTRTGMMGSFGEAANLQTLLRETADQPDILYIAIVDESGRIVAHSDQEQVGRLFETREALGALKAGEATRWRVVSPSGGPKSFEVYKLFLPLRGRGGGQGQGAMGGHMGHMMQGGRGMMSGRGRMMGFGHQQLLDPDKRLVIFIGMDVEPFEAAIAEDLRHGFLMSGILLLLGLTGVVSLFWMQSSLRSRKQLTDIRALTAEMVANIPEGIVVCGPDGRITYVNALAVEMLGRCSSQADVRPGLEAQSVLPPDLLALQDAVAAGRTVAHTELEWETSDGARLPLAVVATNIQAEDGAFVGRMFMLRDLTQVRQLQEEIRKADKMAAIGHLAAGVAHEVRNPLSSIKGYATYFGTQFPEGSENREAAKVMTAEVDRLNRVITELLEMSRPADIKPRETDVAALLDSSLRLVRQEAEGAGVVIGVDVSPGARTATVDPDRLTQAMINLYVNAIQAMPGGGSLDVSARRNAGALLLRVRDTGPGLPEGAAGRIFDPYYTNKNTGTGLGLAIVHKIVEAHGGAVEVERTGPDGTTFAISLPLSTERGTAQ